MPLMRLPLWGEEGLQKEQALVGVCRAVGLCRAVGVCREVALWTRAACFLSSCMERPLREASACSLRLCLCVGDAGARV